MTKRTETSRYMGWQIELVHQSGQGVVHRSLDYEGRLAEYYALVERIPRDKIMRMHMFDDAPEAHVTRALKCAKFLIRRPDRKLPWARSNGGGFYRWTFVVGVAIDIEQEFEAIVSQFADDDMTVRDAVSNGQHGGLSR